jgi:hypothetical protein
LAPGKVIEVWQRLVIKPALYGVQAAKHTGSFVGSKSLPSITFCTLLLDDFGTCHTASNIMCQCESNEVPLHGFYGNASACNNTNIAVTRQNGCDSRSRNHSVLI